MPVRAAPVEDSAEIAQVTAAYRRKYGGSPWLGSVVRPESLGGTLRLEPGA